mmetsp:Transcript_9048/g.13596  ORF Transcript_9048/g.13596 Transcript_9048/m.13596 type:complete len:307 (-) Transcript_9048:186-1106(-)
MGKGWHGKPSGGKGPDVASARGHCSILATCDVAREKEATKEILNLLNQILDEVYPESDNTSSSGKSMSVEELLAAEIRQNSSKQNFVSLNTGVKGLVFVKIVRKDVCPVRMVEAIFDQVERTKLPCCRHLCRIVPLSKVFFPNEEELCSNIQEIVNENFPTTVRPVDNDTEESELHSNKKARTEDDTALATSTEGDNSASAPDDAESEQKIGSKRPISVPLTPSMITYAVHFKRRNHNTLTRSKTQDEVTARMPKSCTRVDVRNPQAVFVVEAFMNMCGIAFVPNYTKLSDFNIGKHQKIHTQSTE